MVPESLEKSLQKSCRMIEHGKWWLGAADEEAEVGPIDDAVV